MGRPLLLFAAIVAFMAAFLAFQAGDAALGTALAALSVAISLYCAKQTAINGLDDLEFVFSLKRGRAPGSYLRGRNLAVVWLGSIKAYSKDEDELVRRIVRTVEHETVHHAFDELKVREDIEEWLRREQSSAHPGHQPRVLMNFRSKIS